MFHSSTRYGASKKKKKKRRREKQVELSDCQKNTMSVHIALQAIKSLS